MITIEMKINASSSQSHLHERFLAELQMMLHQNIIAEFRIETLVDGKHHRTSAHSNEAFAERFGPK